MALVQRWRWTLIFNVQFQIKIQIFVSTLKAFTVLVAATSLTLNANPKSNLVAKAVLSLHCSENKTHQYQFKGTYKNIRTKYCNYIICSPEDTSGGKGNNLFRRDLVDKWNYCHLMVPVLAHNDLLCFILGSCNFS